MRLTYFLIFKRRALALLESRCDHLNFIYRASFEQGLPWHSGNNRVWIQSKTRTWHDQNIQQNEKSFRFFKCYNDSLDSFVKCARVNILRGYKKIFGEKIYKIALEIQVKIEKIFYNFLFLVKYKTFSFFINCAKNMKAFYSFY